MKKSVFVIGLGRFGKNLVLNLIENDVDVGIVDVDDKLIQEFSSSNGINTAFVLDTTNFDALSSLGIERVQKVVVAMTDIESSLLTCANLRDIGVKNIIAKAQNTIHSRLLRAIGVQNVVFPEKDSAELTAQQILYDQINIIKKTKEVTILSVIIKDESLTKKTYSQIQGNDFKIFAIKKNEAGSKIEYHFSTDAKIEKLDKLFIICDSNKLKNIKKIFKNDDEKKKSK